MKSLQLQRFSVFPLSSLEFSLPTSWSNTAALVGAWANWELLLPSHDTFASAQPFCRTKHGLETIASWEQKGHLVYYYGSHSALWDCFVHSQCSIRICHRNVVLKGSIPDYGHSLCLCGLQGRAPKDKQHPWPLSFSGENAAHLEGTGDSPAVPE